MMSPSKAIKKHIWTFPSIFPSVKQISLSIQLMMLTVLIRLNENNNKLLLEVHEMLQCLDKLVDITKNIEEK